MAPPTSNQKTKLSKHLLEMKFMQRTKEKVEQDEDDENRKELFDHEITDDMRKGGSKYVIEQSFIRCENLRFGRMSFNGFNPEIEKLMLEAAADKEEDEEEMATEVSNADMAKRYSSLVNTMAKKFSRPQNFHGKQKKSKPVIQPIASTSNNNKHNSAVGAMPETNNGDKGSKRKMATGEFQKRKRAAEFWKPDDEY